MNITITIIIIGLTCLISYFGFQNQELFGKLKHYPVAMGKKDEWHRFLTSGFLHGSMMHLIVNMYVLYTFGEVVEHSFDALFGGISKIVFSVFYLSAIVFANIPSFIKHKGNPQFASIGASGAVSAVMFVFVLLYPWEGLTFIFFPFFSFPAIVLGVGYLIYSSWASSNRSDGIDHLAHFGGAVYGILFIAIAKPEVLSYFVQQLVGKFN